MKKIVVLAFILSLSYIGMAQRVAVRWSDKYKEPDAPLIGYRYLKAFSSPGETIIGVFKREKFEMYDNDYMLAKLDAKLDVKGQLKLEYPKNAKQGFLDLLKLKQNYYLLEYRFNPKGVADIYIVPLNPATLTKQGGEKKIAEIDDADPAQAQAGAEALYAFEMEVAYSADSSKILLTYDVINKGANAKVVQAIVMNNGVENIYTATHAWPQPADKLQVKKAMIDNAGNIYFTTNIYNKSFSQEVVKGDGAEVPSYATSMVVLSKDNTTTYTFDADNKFLHDVDLNYDRDKKPVLVGTYKDKYNGRPSGIFVTPPVTTATSISNMVFTPYPADLLEKIELDGQGKKSGDKAGLDNDFYTGAVSRASDSVTYMVSEYFQRTPNDHIIKGDIVVTAFTIDGKVSFQRLPRYQNTSMPLSTTEPMLRKALAAKTVDNKLVLMYGDGEDNAMQDVKEKPVAFDNEKRSVVLAVILNRDTKLLSRKTVFSHQDMEGFLTSYRFAQLKANTYVMFATKAGSSKDGLMVGLLTIK